ncbi:MAG: chromosomal replication initiator protein DnaA [Anaerolineae bacterium]|nr:chromosomal replication initiator protein DnaA [Anaerolineae bacterium]
MLEPKQAWQATLGQLQLQLNRATFETWLKGSELLAHDNGLFTIRVRHAYAKDWLEKHLTPLINQTLSTLHGRPSQVNFVVFLPNRKRPDLLEASPLFPEAAGETADAAPTLAESSAPETLAAPAPALPPASTPVASPRAKRRVAAKSAAAAKQPAAQAAVTPGAAPVLPAAQAAEPDYSEWDPRFNEIKRSHSGPVQPVETMRLDRRCTLASFMTGACNQFAWAAAQSVAESSTPRYNPLVIYGDVGLGKTHLLHAIAQASITTGRQVIYTTAEAFTNDLVASIRAKTMDMVRAKYRGAQVLLIDDFEFIAGKTSTEEEIFHTFNAVYANQGQIVVACDGQPRDITGLDVRLRARLEGGLLADLQAPDYETRLKIVRSKAGEQGVTLPDEVAEALAKHEAGNVREIEGLLLQVTARATLGKQPLTETLVAQALHRTAATPARRKTNVSDILRATATYHQLSMDDLLSKRRTKEVVRARHIAMYLAREETEASLPQIGEALGGRNHSTVLHGYQKIAEEIGADETLRQELSSIRQQLYRQPN